MDLERNRLTQRAATISVVYNVTLTLLKFVAAILTGSVSMLSEAMHSGIDVVASTIAYFSVRTAAAPPDDEHNYGHGKVESMAGFSESVLLLVIVAYIVYEAVMRLLHHHPVGQLGIGIAVMVFSATSALLTGRYVSKVGERTGSMALRSNGQHLLVDFWTCIGVLLALVVTQLTHWRYADPIFAIGFALWISKGAWGIAYEAFHQLIDRRLEVEQVERIKEIIADHRDIISYHKLRTRNAGTMRYVDVHIVVPREWSVVEAHDVADSLERQLSLEFQPAVVTIHVDPYDPENPQPGSGG